MFVSPMSSILMQSFCRCSDFQTRYGVSIEGSFGKVQRGAFPSTPGGIRRYGDEMFKDTGLEVARRWVQPFGLRSGSLEGW